MLLGYFQELKLATCHLGKDGAAMGSGQWTPGCGRVPHPQRCLHEEFARRAAGGSAGEPLNTFQTRPTTGCTEGRILEVAAESAGVLGLRFFFC